MDNNDFTMMWGLLHLYLTMRAIAAELNPTEPTRNRINAVIAG